jgi:excinuclease ABC subunit C
MLPDSETNQSDVPPPEADFEEQIVQEVPTGEVTLPLPTEPAQQRLSRLHGKARGLEQIPGVYLFKDTRDVVIYVGKSRSLRDRVSSYFLASTDLGPVKQRLLDYVMDFDVLTCDSEVEALLIENRLIKDLHPRFNARLSDGKSYPYLEITTREDFPGVYVTRKPQASGTKLYGPFTSGYALKQALIYMQRAFKFRTCHLEIYADDNKRRYFRPCLLYAIKQCTAPCADKISREAYLQDIEQFKKFLDSSRGDALRQMTAEMEAASRSLAFEKAAQLRDQIKALRALAHRGKGAKVMQPELFYQDHQAGVRQLQEVLELDEPVRSIEAIDIAHFQGEATVGSLVCFMDGRPFKNGYKRFRIKTVTGIDDFRCIAEVVSRRYREAGHGNELYPDVILIDGGLGQLHAAQAAFAQMDVKPPMVISLAKREEEIYQQHQPLPFKLARTSAALKLLQFARDEAHRFAQGYHHLLIARRQFQDTLRGSGVNLKTRRGKSASVAPGELKVLDKAEIAAIAAGGRKRGGKPKSGTPSNPPSPLSGAPDTPEHEHQRTAAGK